MAVNVTVAGRHQSYTSRDSPFLHGPFHWASGWQNSWLLNMSFIMTLLLQTDPGYNPELERSSESSRLPQTRVSAPHMQIAEERAVDQRRSVATFLTVSRLGTNGWLKADVNAVLVT